MSTEASKVCLIGDASVGKTCIVNRLVKGIFNYAEKSTIGSNFVTTSVEVDGKTTRLAIWDTAGQEKYRSMVSMYYRGSLAGMIVFDITSSLSFQSVKTWYEELRNTEKDIPVVIVGNKLDLEVNRVVSKSEAERLAEQLNCLYFEVSALNGHNVKEAFIELAKRIKPCETGLQYGINPSQAKKGDGECC